MKGRLCVAVLCLIAGTRALAEDFACPDLDSARFSFAFPIAKNASTQFRPGDPARKSLMRAAARLKECATSEGNWYSILRARELLRCDPRGTLDLVDKARRLLPKSVAIATIRARVLGTSAAAMEGYGAGAFLRPGSVGAGFCID
jgi:hypothetical protein